MGLLTATCAALFRRVHIELVERISHIAVKHVVRKPSVVELQIRPDATACLAHRLIGAQVFGLPAKLVKQRQHTLIQLPELP